MRYSPLPWELMNTGFIRSSAKSLVADFRVAEDGSFIVHACNHFEQLLTVAKNLVIGMKTGLDCAPFWTELIKEIAAIEKAIEGKAWGNERIH